MEKVERLRRATIASISVECVVHAFRGSFIRVMSRFTYEKRDREKDLPAMATRLCNYRTKLVRLN